MTVRGCLLVCVLQIAALLVAGCQARPGLVADPGSEPTRSRGVPSGAERVRIEYVVDGDTVIVSSTGSLVVGEATVRLLEVDAPESKKRDEPVQCFARRAARALARLLPVGSSARVVADRDLIDRYGRTLLYVWNADGVFVNERLVRRGFARAVLFRPNDRYIDRLRVAEDAARRERRGLWGACAYFGAPAR
jgi:micrococcal nuclease